MGTLNLLTESSEGIIPESLKYIFNEITNSKDSEWTLLMSFYQIYLEHIQDLFNPKNTNLFIREDIVI